MADQPTAGHREAPHVSIVIPVYNGQEVLADQLSALAQQTYEGAFEVVVADNGSTDDSLQVARDFAHRLSALRVVDASATRGPSHARNAGARESVGSLLLFCDADDVVSPGWVEAMVAASTTTDLLAGSGRATRDPIRVAAAPPEPSMPNTFPFLPWHRSSNLAVSRDTFERLHGFDESRRIGEDVEFCWRAQIKGHRFRFVPEAFVAYRERSGVREAVRRQFTFGLAAPGLYRDFRAHGAPVPNWRWVLRDVFRLLRSAPLAVLDGGRRERWIVDAGGAAGRAVGLFRLLRRSSSKRNGADAS